MKNIRIPAILGGGLALLLSVPFAAAFAMAYSEYGAAYMIRLGIALDPLLSFHRSNDVVYRTYGQAFALVHPLLWLAARNWFRLHPPQTGREKRARALLLWGGGLAALGVVADYFSYDTWLMTLFLFEWIGCLTLWAGCFIFGRALLENGQMPRWAARLFLLSFLVSIAATFALAHFPSGPTFGYALAWLVWALGVKPQAA
ncbi:MAG: hypothetical protein EPO32_12520 [Anaerolineae bacterium]|nr:MAG: hypothetical protein EPO32_12520 [Anaerolineae bacterium]